MKTFWILWNPEGHTPPTARFDTFEDAKNVAAKMQARLGVGTMYVMKAEAGVTVTMKSKWEKVQS